MVMEDRKGDMNAETRDEILRILQETYGEKDVLEWGTSILERLQQTEILRHGMYESCIQSEAKDGYKLDDSALPRKELVAEWIMRDMRKQSECGCPSQGRESAEQRTNELAEVMQKLSYKDSSSAKALFDMWSKGKGIWILRETLSAIQEIWKSNDGERQSVHPNTVVRRLTPLECTRLQGFPDGWVDIGDWTDSKGKKHKDADSPRYKALGNSIALPFWQWMAGRICKQYDRQVTMASLFDGIGGFPLSFSRHGAKPVWASEVEEFCIAVTKRRFPNEDMESDTNS